MATLAVTHPTLLDLTKRTVGDGRIDDIVETLTLQNEMLLDMSWREGNLTTGHKTTVRTGIPEPTWRKFYGGVQPTKSTTAQVTSTCGMLEDYSEVDKALADLDGNAAAFRMSEDKGKLQGFNNKAQRYLMHGNEATEPEAITGFTPLFNTKTGAENSDNLIDGGGVAGQTDCTSMWLVVWGPQTAFGIVPRGSKGGWQLNDKGQVTIENIDGSGGRMEGYRTHMRWDLGLCVRDWRYVSRTHSIDISTLTKNASAGTDLIDCLTQMLEIVPDLNSGTPAIYVNRKVRSFLRRQIANKVAGSTLTMEQVAGKHVMMFDGIPVRRVDAILNSETSLN